jgi:transcription-repair coupling factor (superfamily II helicase)
MSQLDEISGLREDLRDRFGRLPEEAERLLTVFELRASGGTLGLQTVVVQGDEARIKFRQGVAPRMAGLTAALEGVQFAAEVRQMVPLSLRLRRLGGMAIGPGLVRAFTTAIGSHETAESASGTS